MAKIQALQLQGQKATATNEATANEAFETAFS
jgi:hypothetical protein